ncbi:MAG: YbbR-like domain-containing protein, partial [Spirochaetota bacterium]
MDSLTQEEKFFSVPLSLRGVPQGYVVVNNVPERVEVMLKGKGVNMNLVNEEELEVYVDLQNKYMPRGDKAVKVDKGALPQGISVGEIKPRFVTVDMEKVEKKTVRVVPVVVGKPAQGYSFVDAVVKPNTVEIKAPVSVIKGID